MRTQSLSDERGENNKINKRRERLLKVKTSHIFKNMDCKIELSRHGRTRR
ncbi:hypothetical protein ACN2C3_07505 [Aliarcobacter butzleri]